MADPKDIIKELEQSKQLLKQHKESIKWGRPTIEEKVKKLREERKKEVKIKVEPPRIKSKEEIYEELKDRYRNAWKGKLHSTALDNMSNLPSSQLLAT